MQDPRTAVQYQIDELVRRGDNSGATALRVQLLSTTERRAEIAFAAKWWADKLRAATTTPIHDSAEPGLDALSLMACLPMPKALPEAAIGRFQQQLELLIVADWQPWVSWHECKLYTDYEPQELVYNALILAGIDARAEFRCPDKVRFPIKTSVFLRADGVYVHEGQTGETVLVYPKPSEG